MASFDKALAHVLRNEGGYVHDPADRGGPTNMGITLATMRTGLAALGIDPDLDGDGDVDAADVRKLSRAQARRIYRARYWRGPRIDSLADQRVATKVFDLAVNAGPRVAVTLLQRAANRLLPSWEQLDEDGALGPLTQGAVNELDAEDLLVELCVVSLQFYRGIVARDRSQEKFLRGWERRALWPFESERALA